MIMFQSFPKKKTSVASIIKWYFITESNKMVFHNREFILSLIQIFVMLKKEGLLMHEASVKHTRNSVIVVLN